VIILLCFSPFYTQPMLKDKDWCYEEWTPIVQEKQLMDPITLIQGPPGTGKTVVLSFIVYHLARIQQWRHHF
jgi:Cdc6-like AAA superfamily ATPase